VRAGAVSLNIIPDRSLLPRRNGDPEHFVRFQRNIAQERALSITSTALLYVHVYTVHVYR
jgi:hypothetical protein